MVAQGCSTGAIGRLLPIPHHSAGSAEQSRLRLLTSSGEPWNHVPNRGFWVISSPPIDEVNRPQTVDLPSITALQEKDFQERPAEPQISPASVLERTRSKGGCQTLEAGCMLVRVQVASSKSFCFCLTGSDPVAPALCPGAPQP